MSEEGKRCCYGKKSNAILGIRWNVTNSNTVSFGCLDVNVVISRGKYANKLKLFTLTEDCFVDFNLVDYYDICIKASFRNLARRSIIVKLHLTVSSYFSERRILSES